MKIYFVAIEPDEDCEFLNSCTIKHEITPKSEFGHWYDGPTGSIILSRGDMVSFVVEKTEDELALKLKFGTRLSIDMNKQWMPGEKPFFLEAKVVDVPPGYSVAYVKVINGNVYNIKPDTPGIDFGKLKKGTIVEIEITNKLVRVLSARIIE